MYKSYKNRSVWMIIFTGLFIVGLWSCNGESDRLKKRVSELESNNQKLKTTQENKDSSINIFLEGYNEIQINLDSIKERQGIVVSNIKINGDLKKEDVKKNIISDIKAINKLMEKNQQAINNLRSQLKNSNVKIEGLQKLVDEMTSKLQEKDAQIADLQEQVVSLNKDLEYLFSEYNDRINELNAKDSALNVAYYAYGTKKELKDKKVIVNEGGILGIGGVKELKDNFNKGYFTQIDILETRSIPLMAKDASFVTKHPKDSYKFIKKDNEIDSLQIIDPTAFWSASKYCVIIVKN